MIVMLILMLLIMMIIFTLSPLSCTGSNSSVSITETHKYVSEATITFGERKATTLGKHQLLWVRQHCIAAGKQQLFQENKKCSGKTMLALRKQHLLLWASNKFSADRETSLQWLQEVQVFHNCNMNRSTRCKLSMMQSNMRGFVLGKTEYPGNGFASWNNFKTILIIGQIWQPQKKREKSVARMRLSSIWYGLSMCLYTSTVDFGVFATECDTPPRLHTP